MASSSRPAAAAATAVTAGLVRAAVYDRSSPEGVKVVSRKPPARSSSALLVRVMACGINPVDSKFVFADKLPKGLQWIAKRVVNGRVAGFDLSGVVEYAPAGSGFAVGDEVFGAVPPLRGSFAQLVSVPLDQVCLKPASLTHAQAAALVLPGITVLQALAQHGFAPGQHVLVVGGSGGVGHLAVQIAKARGAASVAAVCSARNADFVRRLGADHVVDYTRAAAADSPAGAAGVAQALQKIVASRGGAPFDLVLDTVSSNDARDGAWRYEAHLRSATGPSLVASGPGADPHNYVTIGGSTSGWVTAGVKRLCGVNLFGKGRELFWIMFPGCRPNLETLRSMADEGSVKPAIDATVQLTDEGVREGFRRLNGRRTQGKVVLLC